jgi:hypothetical protein
MGPRMDISPKPLGKLRLVALFIHTPLVAETT